MTLALVHVLDINPIRVSQCCIWHQFTVMVIESSCTRVKRWSASVIRVGVANVNMHVSRHLKEELAWAIDKPLQLIINTILFKNSYTTKNLKNKAVLI